jgi:hypothetical protein
MRQTGISSRFAASVIFHPATGRLAVSTPVFPFTPYLVFHAPTVATTLPNVRIMFALFDWSTMTALFPTT